MNDTIYRRRRIGVSIILAIAVFIFALVGGNLIHGC